MAKKIMVDGAAVKKVAARVESLFKHGRAPGEVRRRAVVRDAISVIEEEIRKDPAAFSRYIISRMLWDANQSIIV